MSTTKEKLQALSDRESDLVRFALETALDNALDHLNWLETEDEGQREEDWDVQMKETKELVAVLEKITQD